MRSLQPPTLFSLLAIVLSSTHTTSAKPLPQDETVLGSDNGTLVERGCANSCGYGGLCCGAQQACLNLNGQPHCGDNTAAAPVTTANNVAGNGQWQLYTTTFTETNLLLRTSTYSSYFGSVTSQVVATPTTFIAPASTSIYCNPSLQESPCGPICCAVGQVCQYQGQCGATVNTVGDVSSAYYSSVTNTASAFIRPTSNTVQTLTSTASPTTTVPFSTPTSTNATAGTASTTNNGLSGGAIAGIVIGVIAGIILLLLICTFFCFKGLLDGFLALLGLGPKRRRREETYIEERHSHHGTGGGAGGRTWYGAARPNRVDRPKKSGFGGFTGVAAGLAALAVILGLKRRRDRREKSEYSGSSYSYSDYTSASSESSDRRTRESRRSRR